MADIPPFLGFSDLPMSSLHPRSNLRIYQSEERGFRNAAGHIVHFRLPAWKWAEIMIVRHGTKIPCT